jgi:hypothetical protein
MFGLGIGVALNKAALAVGLRLLPEHYPGALPKEIRVATEKLGHAPFMTIRLPRKDGIADVLLCATNNSCAAIEEQLLGLVELRAKSRLLQAILHVFQGENYLAAFAFFDWVHAPAELDETTAVHFNGKPGAPPEHHIYYPVFDLCGGNTTPAERGNSLEAMLEAYLQIGGNEPQRLQFIDAIGFAVIRHCGMIEAYRTGLNYLDRLESAGFRNLHFNACRRVLELRERGLPVPPHLEKFAGPDRGYLTKVTCTQPYSEFSVISGGEVLVCCGHLVPMSIGNLEKDVDVPSIWNSSNVRKIRESVVDGTFRYCNHLDCAVMNRNTLPQKDSPQIRNDPVMRAAIDHGQTDVDSIRLLYFGYDSSCNLSCPSCRREIIMEKDSAPRRKAIEEKIKPMLPKIESIFLNSCCEFLVSKPSRNLLLSINPETCPDLKIDLISNGTLFSEAEWAKFANAHSQIRTIRISMDAARPHTFETVRRGGRWPIFFENIKFIARLRSDRRIENLTFSFTYQLANFREMPEFIVLCEELGVDYARFEHLVQTDAMSDAEYAAAAVHEPSHPLYGEFLSIIQSPIFRRPTADCDFRF